MAMNLVLIGQGGSVPISADDPTSSVAGVCEQMVALYERRGFVPPWVGFLAEEGGAWVGTCAFTGPPANGEVEIAYFTFPGYEGKGVATRMATELVARSRAAAEGEGVAFIAHTLPRESSSTSILKRMGFKLQGPIDHPEDGVIWKWRNAGIQLFTELGNAEPPKA